MVRYNQRLYVLGLPWEWDGNKNCIPPATLDCTPFGIPQSLARGWGKVQSVPQVHSQPNYSVVSCNPEGPTI